MVRSSPLKTAAVCLPRVKNCFTCPPQNMSSFIADAEPEKPNKNAPSRALPNERARGVLINLGEQCVWYQSRVVTLNNCILLLRYPGNREKEACKRHLQSAFCYRRLKQSGSQHRGDRNVFATDSTKTAQRRRKRDTENPWFIKIGISFFQSQGVKIPSQAVSVIDFKGIGEIVLIFENHSNFTLFGN